MNNEQLGKLVWAALEATRYMTERYYNEKEYEEDAAKYIPVLETWLQELQDNDPPPVIPRHRAAILSALPKIRDMVDWGTAPESEYQAKTRYAYELAQYWLETTDKRRRPRPKT